MSDLTAEVIIIDDDEAMRDSLELLFSSIGLKTRIYESATHFLDNPPQTCVGCIVTDVRMPNISGIKLIKQLDDIGIILPVIFITGFADVAMAVEAMKLGAVDFIEKPVNQQALIERVQSTINTSIKTAKVCCQARKAQMQLALLTEREHRIAELMAKGERTKEMARELGISTKTVEVHRHNVLSKLGISTPVDVLQLFNKAHTMGNACPTPDHCARDAVATDGTDKS